MPEKKKGLTDEELIKKYGDKKTEDFDKKLAAVAKPKKEKK